MDLVESLYVDSNNIEELASFIHDSAIIRDRVIYFGPGNEHQKLLEVPFGHFCPLDGIIVITVGLVRKYHNMEIDRDPRIGISNEKGHYNFFVIHDVKDYDILPPCELLFADDDDERVSPGTLVSGTFKLTFNPMHKYGACESAQDDGYINTGEFYSAVDLTEPLYLRVDRSGEDDEYHFYYFMIEIFSN